MTEIDASPIEPPRRFQFNWVLPTFWRPRRTFSRVAEESSSTWGTPLLLLTLAVILLVIVSGPIRKAAAQSVPQELPPDYQWWTPEMQERYQESLGASSGPVFTYVLPGIALLSEVWFGWLLMGAVLHLVLTLAGSRTNMGTVLSIVAWAMLPLLLRYLVRTVGVLATDQLISSPGLVGFAPQTPGVLSNYVRAVLPMIDAYYIWSLVLMVVGLRPLPGMTTVKALTGVVISALIVLLLMALPGFANAQLGGLSVTQPFFF